MCLLLAHCAYVFMFAFFVMGRRSVLLTMLTMCASAPVLSVPHFLVFLLLAGLS